MLAAYFGTGLFAYESARNRRLTAQHVREVEQEAELRRDAEQQLKALIESSPAAILTVDSAGKILMANQAAHRLLGFERGDLAGRIHQGLSAAPGGSPARRRIHAQLSDRHAVQRTAQGWGRVSRGHLVFHLHRPAPGQGWRPCSWIVPRIFATRRNPASTTSWSRHAWRLGPYRMKSVTYAAPSPWSTRTFRAIASWHRVRTSAPWEILVEGLGKIATLELRQSAGSEDLAPVDVGSVLDELRIVTSPSLRESGVLVRWDVPKALPRVWAERHDLLQALLNLTKNSQRAMQDQEQGQKEFRVSARVEGERVVVRVRDTGHGISNPERLFQPFQQGADSTGLGLYLSRALVRAFNGDLRYEPQPSGCCFALELRRFAEPVKQNMEQRETHG